MLNSSIGFGTDWPSTANARSCTDPGYWDAAVDDQGEIGFAAYSVARIPMAKV